MTNNEKLNKIFISLITRNEGTKHFVLEQTIENESDSQILCYFISKNCNPDVTIQVHKNYEFKDGFFTPHFSLVEVENDFLKLTKGENNGKS